MNHKQLCLKLESLEKEKNQMYKDEKMLLEELEKKDKVIEVLLRNVDQEIIVEILAEYFDLKADNIVKRMIERRNT